MSHNYPRPGQPTLRSDGLIDQRYLRGFQRELSNLLIQANYAEIISVGAKIHEAKAHSYWEWWPDQEPPFRSFGEWCWAVLNYRERKADAIQKIYLDLTAMNLSEHVLYRALKLGWTKLNVVLRAARSELVLIRWVDRIEEHNLTLDEIQMEVSSVTPTGHRSTAGQVDPPQRPKNKSKPAKRQRTEEGNDAYDEDPAPQSIYPPEGKPPKKVRKTLIFEDEDTAGLVFRAIKTVQNASSEGEIGAAKAISLICQHYMAVVNAETAGTLGGQVIELEKVLQGLEVAYGIPLVIADQKGLLAQARALMRSWGTDELKDKNIQKLLRSIDKALRKRPQ